MKSDLEESVLRGDAEAVRWHLDAGEDPNARDRYGQTGIMLAAVHGFADVVRLYASRGADLDHTAKYGLSALMLAAINGRTKVVEILVAAGADTTLTGSDAGFFGKPALELAREQGHAAIVALLEES